MAWFAIDGSAFAGSSFVLVRCHVKGRADRGDDNVITGWGSRIRKPLHLWRFARQLRLSLPDAIRLSLCHYVGRCVSRKLFGYGSDRSDVPIFTIRMEGL